MRRGIRRIISPISLKCARRKRRASLRTAREYLREPGANKPRRIRGLYYKVLKRERQLLHQLLLASTFMKVQNNHNLKLWRCVLFKVVPRMARYLSYEIDRYNLSNLISIVRCKINLYLSKHRRKLIILRNIDYSIFSLDPEPANAVSEPRTSVP